MSWLLLVACSSGTDSDGSQDSRAGPGDSAAEAYPDPVCEAATNLALVREYPSEQLPYRVSHDHTQQGVALGDLDGDGWLDALMAYGGGSVVFMNDKAGNLVLDDTWTMDGEPLPSGGAVALADLDGDGDLDAYIGRDKGDAGVVLYHDAGTSFHGVPLPNSGQAASTGAFADFDNDGDLDLYVGPTTSDTDANGVINGTITAGDGDRLFIQQKDGSFADETSSRVPSDSDWGWTFQASPLDYDDDGDLDLYLAHDMGSYMLPNRLLKNDGTGHFTRATDCQCELTMFAMGAAVGDANGDSRPDLYVTDIGGPNLLVNLGDGTFADATQALGAGVPATEENLTSWGVTFTDLNLDSWPDVAMVFGQLGQPEFASTLEGTDPSWIDGGLQSSAWLTSDKSGQFARQSTAWPDGINERAIVVGDLDRDGDPDVVTVGKYFLRQYRTDDSCGPAVRVLLEGKGKNLQAIGARVDALVGGRTVTQWALPSTTGSSSAPELYFGLGGLESMRGGTVTWPDGSVTELGAGVAGDTVTAAWE